MADMTLEEALAAADVEERDTAVNDIITIDSETRKINVPDSESVFGVETDMDVERKYFRCPRVVGDNIDLSAHKIYIVYVTAKDVNGTFLPDLVNGKYWCEDVSVEGDYITFSWRLSGNVLSKSGIIAFKVLAKTTDGSVEKTRWNTSPAYCTVLMTVPDGDNIEEQYPDIVTQLLERMDAVEAIATPEAVHRYVEEYLEEHPVAAGATEEQAAQIEQNTNGIAELKSDLSELSEEIDGLKQNGIGGSGVTTAQTESLWALVKKTAFTEQLTDEELNAFKTAWGIVEVVIPAIGITLDKTTLSFTDSTSQTLTATVEPIDTTDKVVWTSNAESVATVANGVVTPISNGSATITATCGSVSATCSVTVDIADEEQVTLTSISAIYAGGDVAVGTSVDDLTDITVTAHYSDGSTANVTGYTLSGTIAEGDNTITVSYGGKSTTFTVTGIVEETETNEPVYQLAEATTFDGTNYVDTGYILNDVDKDFSILVEYVTSESTDKARVFCASKNANNFGPYLRGDTYNLVIGNAGYKDNYMKVGRTFKQVITHNKDSGVFNIYNINDDVNFRYDGTIAYSAYATNQHAIGNTLPLTLGKFSYSDSGYFKGTINQFEIYERVLTSEEIDTFIGATWEAPSETTNLIDINACTLGGSMDDGRTVSEDYYVTDFIPIVCGNPYYANITKYIDDSVTDSGQFGYFYNPSKQSKKVYNLVQNLAMGENFDFTDAIINTDEIAYVRLVFHKNYLETAFFGEGVV